MALTPGRVQHTAWGVRPYANSRGVVIVHELPEISVRFPALVEWYASKMMIKSQLSR